MIKSSDHCSNCCWWQENANYPQDDGWATCEFTESKDQEQNMRGSQSFAESTGGAEAALITHKDFACNQHRDKWQ